MSYSLLLNTAFVSLFTFMQIYQTLQYLQPYLDMVQKPILSLYIIQCSSRILNQLLSTISFGRIGTCKNTNIGSFASSRAEILCYFLTQDPGMPWSEGCACRLTQSSNLGTFSAWFQPDRFSACCSSALPREATTLFHMVIGLLKLSQ